MSEPLSLIDARLPDATHVSRIALLGIPVEFLTDEPAVLAAVETAFGGWRASPPAVLDEPATVRIIVDDSTVHSSGGAITHHLVDGHFVLSGLACSGVAIAARREAVARIGRDVLADGATFRSEVLEALTWALLTRLDRQPLHAAALARDGATLLLHGRSGAGKSTLALAAARNGIPPVADDMVFLQSRPALQVWAASGPLHVLPTTAASLGVDTSRAAVRLRHGTAKVAVDVQPVGDRAFERGGLCVLGARSTRARARRLSEGEAMCMLDLGADPGFDIFADSIAPVIARVIRGGAWLLEPSSASVDAVPLLAAMLEEVAAGGAAT